MKNRIKKIVFSLIILVALIFGIGTLPIINVSADSVDLFWIPVAGSGTGNWSDTNHWAEYYTVGTATFVNGDATVEFGGGADVTSYDDCIIRVLSTGKWYTIDSITDSDTLELTEAFAEANTGAVAYAIAIGGHAVPTATNNVYFNIGSFTGASQVVTVDATAYCKDMDWTGATNSPTLTVSQPLNFYGDVTLIGTLTFGGASYIAYKGTGAQAWTSNGGSIDCQFISSSSATGTLTLQDAFVSTRNAATGFYWSGATLNTNNQTMTVMGFDMAGATAKTLILGSSVINTVTWSMSGSNITITANTSTINCSGNFDGGGLTTYNIVNLLENSTITGDNTYAKLGIADSKTITVTAASTQTFADCAIGSSVTLKSSSTGNTYTLAYTGAVAPSTATGGGLTMTDAIVTASSAPANKRYWVQGTGNWSDDNNHWSALSGFLPAGGTNWLPTASDDVYFDANSFTGASQVVTVDAAVYCKDMDWTGATNSPTLTVSQPLNFYGDVTFIADMTISGVGYPVMWGTGSTVTTNGLDLSNIGFVSFNGSTTLADDFNLGIKDLYVNVATLNTNGKTVTCGEFLAGFGAGNTITLGASIINCTAWSTTNVPTLTDNTATINCSGNFSGGGITTYNIVNLTGATSTISGSNTYAELNLDDTKTQTITFTDGTTQIITSDTDLSGSSGHIHTLQGSGVAGWNLVYTGGSYLSFDYLSVSRSSVTPATNIWYAGTHSTNGGNNTGWFFIAPDAPTVTTQAASGILVLEATINGTITNKGALNTTLQYGFDIGTAAGVYTDSYVTVGDYSGAFLELVDGLLEHTTYYYRAKAQNNVGWGYGSEVSFTTGTETWSYYLEFTVQDTSGADRTNVPVILSSLIGSNLVNAGYIDSDGLDTNLKETTTAMEYLLSTTNGAMVIPNLAASQTRTYRLYLNDWQGQHGFPIIVGDEGYMTVLDAATLELGDNFEIEVSGYIDTDAGSISGKPSAFDLYTDGGDIKVDILGSSTAQISQTDGISIINIYSTNYYAQTFTTTDAFLLNSVDLKIYRVGVTGYTLTVGLYATSAGKPTGEALVTDTMSAADIGTSTVGYVKNFTLPYELEASTMYAIVLSYSGDDGSKTIGWKFQDSDVYAGGDKIASGDSGDNWTIQANDFYFVVNGQTMANYLSATVANGEHIIKVTADGTDINLYIDGVLEDTAALGGASVPDNANNWILFGGNSMTYVNYYKQTVSGTLIAHYQPASMITSTTVPDLEGAAQNGTITWGSNSNLTITMMGITPYTEYVSESSADEVADTVKPATMPDTWYSDITDIADLPFYETFNEKATEMGMPTQTLYVMMMLGTAVAVGLGVLVFTGSALVAVLTCGVTIAAGVNTGILSGWMMLIFFIFGIGILYLSRQN